MKSSIMSSQIWLCLICVEHFEEAFLETNGLQFRAISDGLPSTDRRLEKQIYNVQNYEDSCHHSKESFRSLVSSSSTTYGAESLPLNYKQCRRHTMRVILRLTWSNKKTGKRYARRGEREKNFRKISTELISVSFDWNMMHPKCRDFQLKCDGSELFSNRTK